MSTMSIIANRHRIFAEELRVRATDRICESRRTYLLRMAVGFEQTEASIDAVLPITRETGNCQPRP